MSARWRVTPRPRRCSRCCPESRATWRTSPAEAGGRARRPCRPRAPRWPRCWRRPGIPRGRSWARRSSCRAISSPGRWCFTRAPSATRKAGSGCTAGACSRLPAWETRSSRPPDAAPTRVSSSRFRERRTGVTSRGGKPGRPVPELPEVETIVRDLAPRLEGYRIARARLAKTDVLRRVSKPRLLRTLRGNTIEEVIRRAKHAVFRLSSGHRLIVQPRMTGSLVVYDRALTRDEAKYAVRSEEHTSELQSHSDLVCRLLLEK